ncbi:RagB/SusD family nutrient uptake outer membrane protein [Flavivirga amylovorans]|uniref:RagB/SusD family nutrient uptake outer membrane protein n=1 Tax=Flavivirga amylovorans TaxID=870486 RepID=A0ABT8X043_9FLAO|nr:RagB/SusD family nutrient uptake outer membrane protein [Flavivirga amylovorans]MDO5987083.1 RagB/SusD family nutrient uptake outer membrane protein [Flavivirga amylovorans]
MKKYITAKVISRIVILVTVLFSTSCNEDEVLNTVPKNLVGPDALYTTAGGLETGLNGLYALVRIERAGVESDFSGNGNNMLLSSTMIGGTDNIYGNRPLGIERFLNEWGDRSLNGSTIRYFTGVFDWLYNIIASANILINRAEGISGVSPEDLNRILGEARTIRAWAYRHLTFLFGDVPLNLEEITGDNFRDDWQRNSVEDIRAAMRADLEFAVANLPENHISNGKIIKAVAQHYLAELLIMEADAGRATYQEAIDVALDAINGSRSLVRSRYGVNAAMPGTPFSDMFLKGNSNPNEGNTEVLWVFQYANFIELGSPAGTSIMRRWLHSEYGSTSDGAQGLTYTVERGGRGLNRISATKFQFDLYRDNLGNIIDDRGDEHAWRLSFTLKQHSLIDPDLSDDPLLPGQSYGDTVEMIISEEATAQRNRAFVRKWDDAPEENPRFEKTVQDQIYLRLADTYLLLAEAYFKNGDNTNAAFYINELRGRANAPLISPGDVTLDYILDERARELFSEEHRRYTLLRNNKWVERTNLYNKVVGNINPNRDRLYPIPQNFIDSNVGAPIEQNPGY